MEIKISEATNGFIMRVGNQTMVFKDKEELVKELLGHQLDIIKSANRYNEAKVGSRFIEEDFNRYEIPTPIHEEVQLTENPGY